VKYSSVWGRRLRCGVSRTSEVACRAERRALTSPASWMAPPNSSSFSVSVVLPASGCEMMAQLRRRSTSSRRRAASKACPSRPPYQLLRPALQQGGKPSLLDTAASSERACTAGPLCACSAAPLVLASGASAGLLPASVSVAAAWDVQRRRCAPGRRTRPAQRSAAAQRASHAVSQPRLCRCRRCSRSVPMLRAAAPAGSATRAREAVTSFKEVEQYSYASSESSRCTHLS